MRVAILTAILGDFDTPVDPVQQKIDGEVVFHRFTDKDFPPIASMDPRFQYRIPKMFGWEMFPGYDYYIWLDGSFSFDRWDSAQWFLDQIGDAEAAFFKHPWRNTAQEETDHIEEYLQKGDKYITPRYRNGLHKEQMAKILFDQGYIDDKLYTSTAFIYKNNAKVHQSFKTWWQHTSRYFTVDQIALPYVTRFLKVNVINQNQYKCKYLKLVSEHK